ncbi:hypothetical protein AB6A40_005214 [Gnathostoma spinigerum]|uniref:Uncharacterized protein n=1 Tax=Gnathostoma spinigerum TaxID=75299 RepID=A0ABD6EFX4_9BILA
MRALVQFHSKNGTIEQLFTHIVSVPEITNTFSSQVLPYLFYCLLQSFHELLLVSHRLSAVQLPISAINNFGIWISKIGEVLADEREDEEILSPSGKRSAEEIWVKVMCKFFDHISLQSDRYQISDPGNEIQIMLRVMYGDIYRIEVLPRIIRLALLGALLQLITVMSGSHFIKILFCINHIFRSDPAYFRVVLGRCSPKSARSVYRRVINRGIEMNVDMAALKEFTHHYLLAYSEPVRLLMKSEILIHESGSGHVSSQGFIAEAVARSLYESEVGSLLKDKLSVTEFLNVTLLPFITTHIEWFNSNDLAHVDINDIAMHMTFLSPFHISHLIYKRLAISAFDSHLYDCLYQVCKRICIHPARLNRGEENSLVVQNIVQAAVYFVLKYGRISRLMKWKYLTNIVRYDRNAVIQVILSATYDELEKLLHSRIPSSSEKEVLEICSIIAELNNDRKKNLLLSIFTRLIQLTTVVVEQNPPTSLRFAVHLVELAKGSAKEGVAASMTLGIISTGFPCVRDHGILKTEEFEDLIIIEEALEACLHHASNSICFDQCALFAQIFSSVLCCVQMFVEANGKHDINGMRLVNGVSRIAQSIVIHKDAFSRVAPFIISGSLLGAKYTQLALHRLLSVCDKYSIALLSSSLPFAEKRQFALIFSQFQKATEFIS